MNCPKCQAPMRTVNRDGVHIDQCTRCRGVFLDAGELEQIAAAEERFYGSPPPYEPPGGRQAYPDSPRGYRGGYRDSPPPHGHGHRRKRSFLEGLFD
ncbi:MAG: zf-TFIIB domain-containing protein [Acidimicrobiales bacterium]